jgi:hypothetical protein
LNSVGSVGSAVGKFKPNPSTGIWAHVVRQAIGRRVPLRSNHKRLVSKSFC